ncbi:PAS domain-containing protein [Streptomyces smyrnaeus]|uniref:PAS domain-containing protein n=1 Tax=Streptomyces smyrnaeus TaxID=1387713 RepID=UPI0037AFBC70
MSSRPSRGAARLAAILDALPDALLLVNCNGTVVNANAIALETFETPGTALVGRGLLDLLPEFDSKRIPGSMRRPDEAAQTQGRQKPTRMVARRTDGSEFPVEVTSANLEDGRTPYASAFEAAFADHPGGGGYTGDELLMLVVRDLTGTLDTEAELARQQRQTEMILRAASEGVVGVDAEGRVVLVNPAAAQILGYRASDLGGRQLHPLVHHSRPDGSPLPFEETPLADTLRSGRKHRVRAGQVLWAKDGQAVPVDMTTAPVRDGEQLVGAVLTFADRRPYDAVAARQKQLRAVLEESLRGPLEELRQELSGLTSDPAAQLWPEANQILHHLSAGYARMTTLVDNVLGYQRLDTGQERLRTEPVPMDAVVSAGVEGATELIGPGRAQFAVHAPPIEAEVDPERLAVALAHLIADVAGVDATGRTTAAPPPGVDPTIVVAAAQRGEVVRVEVRGPHSGGSRVHEPLVRGIVTRHGGVLQTHEVPGSAGGSAYVLEVPVKAVGNTTRQSGSRARRTGPGDTSGTDSTGGGIGADTMGGGIGADGTGGSGRHDRDGSTGAGRSTGGRAASGGDSTGGGHARGRSGSHARGGSRSPGNGSQGGEDGAFGVPSVVPGTERGETTVMPVPSAPARGTAGHAQESGDGGHGAGPDPAGQVQQAGQTQQTRQAGGAERGQGTGEGVSATALEPVADPRQSAGALAPVPDPRQSFELGPGPSAATGTGGGHGDGDGPHGGHGDGGGHSDGGGQARHEAGPRALGPARPTAGNEQPGAGTHPAPPPAEHPSAAPHGRPIAPVPAQGAPYQQAQYGEGAYEDAAAMPRPTGRRRGRPSPAEQHEQAAVGGQPGARTASGALELPSGGTGGSESSGEGVPATVPAQGSGRRARRALGERAEDPHTSGHSSAPPSPDAETAQDGLAAQVPSQQEAGGAESGQPGEVGEASGGLELTPAGGGRRARRIAAARARAQAEAAAQQGPHHAPFALPPAPSQEGPSSAEAEQATPSDPAYDPYAAQAASSAMPGGMPPATSEGGANTDAGAPEAQQESGPPQRGDSSVVAASPILGGGALQQPQPQTQAPQSQQGRQEQQSRQEQHGQAGQPGQPGRQDAPSGPYGAEPGPRVRTLGQGVPFAERMAEQTAAAQQWPPAQSTTPSATSAIPSTPSSPSTPSATGNPPTPAAPAGAAPPPGSGRRRKLATPEERAQGGAPSGPPRSDTAQSAEAPHTGSQGGRDGQSGSAPGQVGHGAIPAEQAAPPGAAPTGRPQPGPPMATAPGQAQPWTAGPGQADQGAQHGAAGNPPGQLPGPEVGQAPGQLPGAGPAPDAAPRSQAQPPALRQPPGQEQGPGQGPGQGQGAGQPGPMPGPMPMPRPGPQEFTVGSSGGAPGTEVTEGPEPLDGPDSPVEMTDGRGFGVPPHAMDDELPPEPLDNPRRLLVWPEPDVSTQQALSERGYRPVLVHSREEVDAQIAAYPAALFVDPLTGPITRTALQSLRTAAVAAEVPVLVTAGLGQATREAAYGADPAVLLKALAPRDSEQHPPRVLLVEEQQAIAAALAATLERRGMQVAHAPTDSEAVHVAGQIRPNLVVMDLMQVRRRRAGIIDWLRVNGMLNRTPFVVYTSADLDPGELPRLASGETVLFLAERSTSPEVQSRIVDLLTKIGAH